MKAFALPACIALCAVVLSVTPMQAVRDVLNLLDPVAAAIQWLLDIVRTNYVLQGLIGSMCMTWAHTAMRSGLTLCVDAVTALLCTCLTVEHANAPREYMAVKTYLCAKLRKDITGNATVAAFEQQFGEADETIQFQQTSGTCLLPIIITVQDQRVIVAHNATSKTYNLYVLGTRRFATLRRCIEGILTSSEKTDSGFVAMMLDDNLRWTPQRTVRARRADTLFMDETDKQRLLNDMRDFFGARKAYERLGKPWRRSHLYSGEPGVGKSTFAIVAASELHVPLCMLNMSNPKLNDSTLCTVLCNAPSPGIILLEDLDCMGLSVKSRERKDESSYVEQQHAAKCAVTMSGLLNAFDSACAHVGHIVCSTTNVSSKLDAAVCRPGRLGDVCVEFSTVFGFKERVQMLRHYFPALDGAGAERLVDRFDNASAAAIESKCMAVAPFHTEMADAGAIASLLRLPKQRSNAAERSLVYACWKVDAVELFPELVRYLSRYNLLRSMDVRQGVLSLHATWASKRRSRFRKFDFGYPLDDNKAPELDCNDMLKPLTAEQVQQCRDLTRNSVVSSSVWYWTMRNNLDDFEAGCVEVLPKLTFNRSALTVSAPEFTWEDIVPFCFIEPWEELRAKCTLFRKVCGNEVWSLTADYIRFKNLVKDEDALRLDKWLDIVAMSIPSFTNDSPFYAVDRRRIAELFAVLKGCETDECWRLARRLCPLHRPMALISEVWMVFFMSKCDTADKVIDMCIEWEAAYAREFKR